MRAVAAICGILVSVLNAAASAQAPPRLVVLVSVDQLPRQHLDRFAALFSRRGFGRLSGGGADFRDAHHDHLVTATAPGHAVLLTGAYPVHHGIVGNWWYSPLARQMVTATDDLRFRLLLPPGGGAPPQEPGASPQALRSTTLGDGLRLATGMRARVVSVALKSRSAVLMGGSRPNGAYWFDEDTCTFISSSYYADALPDWVARFNASAPCSAYLGTQWSKLRQDVDYERYADPDAAPYELDPYGLGRTFPHPIRLAGRSAADPNSGQDGFEVIRCTPFGNDLLLRFALAAIENEQLGEDEVTDLLAIGFSSPDVIGHAFGPDSQETMDAILRLDASMAELMDSLDRHVGRRQWLLVLTSDHGVAPIPERLERFGVLPARDDHYRFSPTRGRLAVEEALRGRFGSGELIAAWHAGTHPFVHVRPDAGSVAGQPIERILSVLREEIARLDGVARVYDRREIAALAASRDGFEQRVYRSWHSEEGGDLLVQLEPYWIATDKPLATSHGSPYAYDTHVPLVFYGPGIAPGSYERRVALVDLAPTLARLLGIGAPPSSVGRVLREAVR